MINSMAKFIPEPSTAGQPPASAPVLSFYDTTRSIVVSADASSYRLGGVLLQQHGEDWKPVASCTRRLMDAETRDAQIGKECLASVGLVFGHANTSRNTCLDLTVVNSLLIRSPWYP